MPLPRSAKKWNAHIFWGLSDCVGQSGHGGWLPKRKWCLGHFEANRTWWKLKLSAHALCILKYLFWRSARSGCQLTEALSRYHFAPASPANIPRWRWALSRIPAHLVFHIKNDFHISFHVFSTMPGAPQDLQNYFIYLGDSSKTRDIDIWGLLSLIVLWTGNRRKSLSDRWRSKSPKKDGTQGKPENKSSETLLAALGTEELQRWSCWGYSLPGRETH